MRIHLMRITMILILVNYNILSLFMKCFVLIDVIQQFDGDVGPQPVSDIILGVGVLVVDASLTFVYHNFL